MTRMTFRSRAALLILLTIPVLAGCITQSTPPDGGAAPAPALVGAWRAKVTFRSGPLAQAKDLEFLYAYNAGGTMTESSNYDEAANSSPPAYGVWKQTGPRTFETKYVFFTTRAPEPDDHAPGKSDWWPAGRGELTETVALSDDGRTSTSTIKLVTYDRAGEPVASGAGEGTGTGTRID